MKQHRWRALWILGITGFFLGATERGAAPAEARRVSVLYASLTADQAPLWITHEAGFFREEGLRVEIAYDGAGGSLGMKALLAGEIQVAQTAGPLLVHTALGGGPVVMMASGSNILNMVLVTLPSIRRPAQLKGGIVGISRFGTLSDFAARQAILLAGLRPGQDVAVQQVGPDMARVQAMERGALQAAVVGPPATLAARRLGFPTLVDFIAENVEFQGTGLVTTRALLTGQPQLFRPFLRAYVRGIALYKMDRERSLQIMGRQMRTGDRELLEESYAFFALKVVPRKPYPTARGLQRVLDWVAERNPRAREVKPQDLMDPSLVRELDESGYIDSLYRR